MHAVVVGESEAVAAVPGLRWVAWAAAVAGPLLVVVAEAVHDRPTAAVVVHDQIRRSISPRAVDLQWGALLVRDPRHLAHRPRPVAVFIRPEVARARARVAQRVMERVVITIHDRRPAWDRQLDRSRGSIRAGASTARPRCRGQLVPVSAVSRDRRLFRERAVARASAAATSPIDPKLVTALKSVAVRELIRATSRTLPEIVPRSITGPEFPIGRLTISV